ncbi:TonB-dependent receptor plug domain-containing protein [Novosphingobium sediminicola]|uniref:Outer membrane receptor protein involved in Fe transport n=1 Tax=Novosphingobium sediminicola TaxID=563162 RepID=A0A7W6G4Z4_9SPHN|nr:TonB-dependent receptor [Novosphingobium sediminicola]MBB3953771.1 outer membrane receptor protein involved in Fe transport [Novosphingobium sediminicola]
MKTHHVSALLLLSASPLALSSQAHAQTAQPEQEIIVTGSRIITNGNNSPAPVTVVSTEQLFRAQPSTIADGLNNMPIFASSRGQSTNVGNGGQNGAANVLNLRSLGALRTLILYDGHRVPPTTPDGQVNVDMIPQTLLQRVDLVTGGVSAVYGSDAMSGVVNFIPDTTFTGLKWNAQSGISQRGDDNSFQAGAAWGTKFADGRGHFEASYQFNNDPGIFDKSNRPWASSTWTVQGNGSTANPYHLVRDTRLSTYTYGGLITNGALANQSFGATNTLHPFVNGAASGTTGIQSGGEGAYYNMASLKSALRTHQLFARLDYEVSDHVKAYLQGSGTFNWNHNSHQNIQISGTLSTSNPYLPSAYQAAMAPATTFTFNKMLQGVAYQPESQSNQFFFLGGFKGDLGGWKWDVGATYSKATQKTLLPNNVNNGRLAAAMDAVTNPANGQIVCRVTLTNPSAYPGCVPINLFGAGAESQAALDYIIQPTSFTATTTMKDVSGSITGAPFRSWAGDVKLAFSAELRQLSLKIDSTAQPTDHPDCTGLTANCTATTALYRSNTQANMPLARQTVSEAAIEAEVPLLADHWLAKALNINGAARFAHYDTSGNAFTWKLGGVWHVNDEFTLRVTQSRDFRAPNLYDLFAPTQVNPGNMYDLHTNMTSASYQINASNPNLKPEKGNTITIGAVYKPHWLPGASLAVDYYNIRITDAIQSLGGGNLAVQRLCEAAGGNSPYCSLLDRPLPFSNTSAANFPTAFYNRSINIASARTNGLDVEANYNSRLFNLRLLYTYQPHIRYLIPGIQDLDAGGAGFGAPNQALASPKHRITAMMRFNVTSDFTIDVMERFRSGLSWNADPTFIYSEAPIKPAAYTNLTLTHKVRTAAGNGDVFLTVQNLFDRAPSIGSQPAWGAIPGLFTAWPNGDDPIGRYFTLGVRMKM